jgi:hypothetical protein
MEMLAQTNSSGALFFTLLIAFPSGRSCSTSLAARIKGAASSGKRHDDYLRRNRACDWRNRGRRVPSRIHPGAVLIAPKRSRRVRSHRGCIGCCRCRMCAGGNRYLDMTRPIAIGEAARKAVVPAMKRYVIREGEDTHTWLGECKRGAEGNGAAQCS